MTSFSQRCPMFRFQEFGDVRAMLDNDVDVSTGLLYKRQIKDFFITSNSCSNISELSTSLVYSDKVLMNLIKEFTSKLNDWMNNYNLSSASSMSVWLGEI